MVTFASGYIKNEFVLYCFYYMIISLFYSQLKNPWILDFKLNDDDYYVVIARLLYPT